MEELVDAGLVKNIGVCNLGTAMIRDLLSYARIHPVVNQVEMHPYLTPAEPVAFLSGKRNRDDSLFSFWSKFLRSAFHGGGKRTPF